MKRPIKKRADLGMEKRYENMHFVCENICLTVLCYSEIFIYTLRVKVIIIKVSINFTGRDSA